MFITADQLLAHAVGDYILQSDWMAQKKTKAHWPAFAHAWMYSNCFLLVGANVIHRPAAYILILSSHFFIDRYRLARYVVWVKNWIGPRKKWFRIINGGRPYWTDEAADDDPPHAVFHADGYNAVFAAVPPFWACRATGYPPNTAPWLSVWLLIIADNILHVICNGLALRYL